MNCIILLFIAGVALAHGHVVHMSQQESRSDISDKERQLFKYLLAKQHHGQVSRLVGFELKNCGDPKSELLLINQLTISPDPIPTSGSLTISFKAQVRGNITSPLKASVELKKDILGVWIPVPCVDNVGSCDYDNICQMLNKTKTCPPAFVANKIPCHCPFPAGSYALPSQTVKVNLADVPEGGYRARVNLQMASTPVGCYELDFSVQ